MFEEKLKRNMDYIGLVCEVAEDIVGDFGSLGKGTVVLVISSSVGLTVKTRGCDACGIKLTMSGLKPESLNPIARVYRPLNRWDSVESPQKAWEFFDEWKERQKHVDEKGHPKGRPLIDIL